MQPVVINQQYEPRRPSAYKPPAEIFPDAPAKDNNPLRSIATILAQALSTRDNGAVK